MSWSISIVGRTLGKNEAEQVRHEHEVLARVNDFLKDLVKDHFAIIDAHVQGAHVHHRTHIPAQAPEIQEDINFLHDVEKEVGG